MSESKNKYIDHSYDSDLKRRLKDPKYRHEFEKARMQLAIERLEAALGKAHETIINGDGCHTSECNFRKGNILGGCDCVIDEILSDPDGKKAYEEFQSLKTEKKEFEELFKRIMADECPKDEKHCACVPYLRIRIEELEAENKRLMRGPCCLGCGSTNFDKSSETDFMDGIFYKKENYACRECDTEGDFALVNDARYLAAKVKEQSATIADHCKFAFDMGVQMAGYVKVIDAARGLSFGTDWNKGTHAKIYRPKLITALKELENNHGKKDK